MRKRIYNGLLFTTFLYLLVFVSGGKANAASQRLFNIVVKDGYTTQTIEMKYGKSPYGYTTYYASQSVIYVNQKAKNVTFQVKKNTSSRFGNFRFAAKTMKPGSKAKSNLFTYTADGKTRAWMFTVQKITNPSIRTLKVNPSIKGKVFVPGKKRYVQFKSFIDSEIPVKVNIRVFNEDGKRVYHKNYAAAGTKTYKLKWDGKVSKDNRANLNPGSYVPDGEYTVRITATLTAGKEKQEFTKEKKFIVGKK